MSLEGLRRDVAHLARVVTYPLRRALEERRARLYREANRVDGDAVWAGWARDREERRALGLEALRRRG